MKLFILSFQLTVCGQPLENSGGGGWYPTRLAENEWKGQKPFQYEVKAYYLQETGNKNNQLTHD